MQLDRKKIKNLARLDDWARDANKAWGVTLDSLLSNVRDRYTLVRPQKCCWHVNTLRQGVWSQVQVIDGKPHNAHCSWCGKEVEVSFNPDEIYTENAFWREPEPPCIILFEGRYYTANMRPFFEVLVDE